MDYKIRAVKSIDDPAERRQRLAALFGIFEKNTAPDDILADESDAATEPTAKAARPADCASRRRAGQGR